MKKTLLLFISIALIGCQINNKSSAEQIHKNVITIDTHDDIDVRNFTDSLNYTMNTDTQVNLPKMQKGGLDVAWFIVYTGQDSLNEQGYLKASANAEAKFDAIHNLVNKYASDQIELALTASDVSRIWESGKKVAMIGVENAYPMGLDTSNLKRYYDRGARYVSLAHNGHSQFADSNTGEYDSIWLHNGLSELGKQMVHKMNYYGIMIDLSHPSKKANLQTLELSKAPVIASHSSARTLCDHPRNLDGEQLMAIKENGGVVQTVALNAYLNAEKNKAFNAARDTIYKEISKNMGIEMIPRSRLRSLTLDQINKYRNDYKKITDAAKPEIEKIKQNIPPVSIEDLVNHIDYMVSKIGIDHVGISSDFDGGGGIEGWQDASETLNVTRVLVKRGYSEEQIRKLWGGNLLRVMERVEQVSKEMRLK
ncbi:MAG: peptidase M19 [Flavobacteriaceae bacterium]|nr:peptidase M19 [Flavobacteriaceae bacterium]